MDAILVCSLCLLMWTAGVFFISRKQSGGKLVRRTLYLGLAMVGLALLLCKPQQVISLPSEVAHILTPYNTFETDNKGYKSESTFENVYDFLNSEIASRASEVHIYGLGLERDELELMNDYKVVFHPADTIAGVNELTIPKITERKRWTLRGKTQGNVDKIFMHTKENEKMEAVFTGSDFELTSTAPVAGSYLLNLYVVTGQDTLMEILPIEVLHEPTWQMLILSSYPSFENNYLKNYWPSKGNGFALRTKISKEKYHTSFVNTESRNLDDLTLQILEVFDFLITDVATWNQLSQTERRYIKSAVRNNGLALVIRPDKNQASPTDLSIPTWNEAEEIEWETNGEDVTLTKYNVQGSWRAATMKGHQICKYRSIGLGHYSVLTIEDSYKLILADQNDEYQSIWAEVFSSLFRDFSPKAELLHNQWIWENQKATVSVLSDYDIDSTPQLNDSISLTYANVPFINGVTEISLWPEQGYNKIAIGGIERPLSIYAHAKNTWQAVKQHQLFNLNLNAANTPSQENELLLSEKKQLSLFWWFLLSLLGFGLLWLDERLF